MSYPSSAIGILQRSAAGRVIGLTLASVGMTAAVRRLGAVLLLPALLACGLLAAPAADGAVRIVRPAAGAVVDRARLPVRVVVRATRRPRVTVGGRDVSGRFERRGRRYAARLGAAQGLRRGRNALVVRSGARRRTRTLFVARRAPRLLRLAAPDPTRATVRVRATHPHRAQRIALWLNGRRVRGGAAPLAGGRLGLRTVGHRVHLAGHHGLRHGRNRLRVRVVDPRGLYDSERVAFTMLRGAPIPAAGRDRLLDPGEPPRLRAAGAKAGRGGKLSFRWRIVRAPRGSKAELRRARSRRPRLRPDVNGRYVIEQVVRERRRGRGGRAEASVAMARDRVVLHQAPDIPVSGLRLETNVDDGIKLGDKVYAKDESKILKLVAIEGRTLEVRQAQAYGNTMDEFERFRDAFLKAVRAQVRGTAIVIVSCARTSANDADVPCVPAQGKTDAGGRNVSAAAALVYLVDTFRLANDDAIGRILDDPACIYQVDTRFQCKLRVPRGATRPGFSLAGAPSRPGDGRAARERLGRGFASAQLNVGADGLSTNGRIVGWFQTPLPGTTDYRLVATENYEYDTRQSDGVAAGQVAMRVAGRVVAAPRPSGAAGFHFVALDPNNRKGGAAGGIPLQELANRFVAESQMATLRGELSNLKSDSLILLQSYGRPKPRIADPAWGEVGALLEKWGATRYLFNSMDGSRDYAFVAGRAAPALVRGNGIVNPREISKRDVELGGRLLRTPWFALGPGGTRPTSPGNAGSDATPLPLLEIALMDPEPWNETGTERCASRYVAERLKLTDDGSPVRSLRDWYPTHVLTADWDNVRNRITEDAPYPSGGIPCGKGTVSKQAYEDAFVPVVRAEIDALGTLAQGIKDLQAPFQTSGTDTILGVAGEVYKAAKTPEGDTTAKVLGVIEGILKAAAAVAGEVPDIGPALAGGLTGVEAVITGVEPFVTGGSATVTAGEINAKAGELAKQLGDDHRRIATQMESFAGQIAGDRRRLYAFKDTELSLLPTGKALDLAKSGVVTSAARLAWTTLLPLKWGAYHIPLAGHGSNWRTFACRRTFQIHPFGKTPKYAVDVVPHANGTGPGPETRNRYLILAPPSHARMKAGHLGPHGKRDQVPQSIVGKLAGSPSQDSSNAGYFEPTELFADLGAVAPKTLHSDCDQSS